MNNPGASLRKYLRDQIARHALWQRHQRKIHAMAGAIGAELAAARGLRT